MKFILYDIFLHLAMILIAPYYLIHLLFSDKYRGSLGERLAFYPSPGQGKENLTTVWFHAVSVGETRAVMPLLRRFKERHPEVRIVFSTVTRTGRERAKDEGGSIIDQLIYMPLDLSWVVRRALRKIRPSLFIIVEKEYWPNMIRSASARGAQVLIINATISKRSFSWYSSLSCLFADVFGKLSLFCAKRDIDAERASSLGVEQKRIHKVGNIKFDMEDIDATSQIEGLRAALGITKDDQVIVAGSTHPGEEVMVLDAFKEIKKEHPEVKLIIAPRHPNRFDEVERIINKAGFKTNRRSQCAGDKDAIILLDTIGDLFFAYAISKISFVGGSLVPIGGHNLFEPAYYCSPVLYGENIETCRDMAVLLEEAGGAIRVKDLAALTGALRDLLTDEKRRKQMGKNAKAALEANRGATEKTLELIDALGALKDKN